MTGLFYQLARFLPPIEIAIDIFARLCVFMLYDARSRRHLMIISVDVMPAERLEKIIALLRQEGRVLANDLAARFNVSEDTIRRDLRDLAGRGLCQRVYGGALVSSPAAGNAELRKNNAHARKFALGRVLAKLIRPKQFVFIDAGSTNLAAARLLPIGLGITVVTHDPAIAAALVGRDGIELIIVGGRVDPFVGAAVGGQTLKTIAAMRPELLLLGACALDIEAGVAAFNIDDAEIKRSLVESAGSVALGILNEKLTAAAPFIICSIEMISDLIVEDDASSEVLAAVASCGPRIHRAPSTEEKSS